MSSIFAVVLEVAGIVTAVDATRCAVVVLVQVEEEKSSTDWIAVDYRRTAMGTAAEVDMLAVAGILVVTGTLYRAEEVKSVQQCPSADSRVSHPKSSSSWIYRK